METPFWPWSMVTVWRWTTLRRASFHLLPKPRVTDSFRNGHGDGRSSSCTCDGPTYQRQLPQLACPTPFSHAKCFRHPPKPPWSPGRRERAGPRHQQLIVGHQQTLRGGVPKRCRSSNLISGIIGPSVFLQITSLSTASIFSCETLIRKFKKSWMQRKHLAAIFTFDVLHFLPFTINTSLHWTLPKSNRWGVIYLPFSYYLPSSTNTNTYDDMQTTLSEK